ncbi:MAG: DUF58 domain-containing protein [Ilumatobacteraceae bacterium]
MTRDDLPLTSTGLGVALGSVILAIVAALTGYRELLFFGLAALCLIAIAIGLPRIASPVVLERRLAQAYVQRGDSAEITLTATSERATPPLRIIDTVVGQPVRVDLGGIKAMRTVAVTYRAVVRRRGVHQVGPIREERRDPFSLAVRSSDHPLFDELWVHPVIHPLRNASESFEDRLQTQAMRALSDDPLAEFQTLRDYAEGDDPRRIHWASSARLDRLVVRDLLELRRRERHVLLETLDQAGTEGEFEECVEIAASLAMAGLDNQMQVVVRTRDPNAAGRPMPVRSRLEILELFTKVERVSSDRAVAPQRSAMRPRTTAQLIVVTGANSPLIPYFCSSTLFRPMVFVVRVSDRPHLLRPIPVPSIAVRNAEEFVQVYDGRRPARRSTEPAPRRRIRSAS